MQKDRDEEELLYIRRDRIVSSLTALSNFANDLDPSTSIEAMSVRLATLNETWQEYKSLHDRFVLSLNADRTLFSTWERKYHITKAILLEQIKIRDKSG